MPSSRRRADPWKSATEADLPGDGVDGSLLQAGAHLYYIGGTSGTATRLATTNVSVASIDAAGLGTWSAGTPLPEARAHAGVAFFAGKAYVIGGASDTTPATTSVYVGTPDATSGLITAWERLDALELPAARSGAAITVVSDGIVVLGGEGADRSPTTTVWKAKLGASGRQAVGNLHGTSGTAQLCRRGGCWRFNLRLGWRRCEWPSRRSGSRRHRRCPNGWSAQRTSCESRPRRCRDWHDLPLGWRAARGQSANPTRRCCAVERQRHSLCRGRHDRWSSNNECPVGGSSRRNGYRQVDRC